MAFKAFVPRLAGEKIGGCSACRDLVVGSQGKNGLAGCTWLEYIRRSHSFEGWRHRCVGSIVLMNAHPPVGGRRWFDVDRTVSGLFFL